MSPAPIVHAAITAAELSPSPIDPSWIIDGAPAARVASLSRSADGSAWTDLWDCTAGSFHWHYSINETIHVVDGGAVVTDRDGATWELAPGDVMQFLVGTQARWHVPRYVRKVAFCSEPVPRPLTRLLRARNRVQRLANRVLGRA